MAILVYLFFIAIFLVVPLPAQLILLVINFMVPDPIPLLDEVIMSISVLKKLITLGRIWEFFEEHKFLTLLIVIGLLVLLYNLIF